MSKDKKLYDKNSIESLSPLEFTRLRPGVYAGDTTYSTQLLVEIISNAIDEYRLGHGNVIEVTIDKDIVTVRDYGQGFIPNSYREDKKTILEAAFSVLNTSGKYREDGTYEGTSLGSFGIGSKITTFLSHWLNVSTWRDGKFEQIAFKEGEFSKRESTPSGSDVGASNGTRVVWQPSEDFFTNTIVDEKAIKDLFKTTACLCPGLTIKLNCNGEKTEYYSKNGLMDLVDNNVKDKELLNNRLSIGFEEGKYKLDLIMTYTSSYSLSMIPYVNTGLTESGPHITQIKAIITRTLNQYLRDKKILKDKDENLSGDDFQEGMYIVFNITAPGVSYDAQVKSRITKIEMKPFTNAIVSGLESWLEKNPKDAKMIADKAILAKTAREKAKKAKEAVRTPKDSKSKLLNLPTKLVDANCKDRTKCELFLTEGDSASGNLIQARDAMTQGVFPLRGKILAVYKANIDKIMANQEIVGIIKALGLEMDSKTHKLKFDENKIRYGKIVLACDADPDGASIKNLLIELFWWLCPEIIEKGYLYSAEPPLFRITTNKNKYIYLKDAIALEEYKNLHNGEKYLISRNKGLGEQDADELAECLLTPETRNIKKLVVQDYKEAAKLIETLMGPSVPPRRAWLLEHSEEAND